MSRSAPSDSPWVSKHLFDALQTRCATAEDCLKRLLVLIDETVLDRHLGDWKAATAEILQDDSHADHL